MKLEHIYAVFLSFSLLFSISYTANAQDEIDSNYVFSGYTERLALFNKMPIANGAIIFLGNSLTEAGRWKDIAPELPILNRGISGDISFGVVARLDEIIRHRPSKIFLMIGINDLKRNVPTDYIVKNYARIVSGIKKESPKTKIYLNSIMPINDQKIQESFKAVKNSDVKVLNEALRMLSSQNKNVSYVDLYPLVADRDGQLRSEITPDGIHLDVSAYVELVDYLKKIKAL